MTKREITISVAYQRNGAARLASFPLSERKSERAQLCFQISMPLDDDAISALSMCELAVRAAGYRQARAAERVAQRKAMLAGAAATDNDHKDFYAEKIRESQTVIQKQTSRVLKTVKCENRDK